MKFYTQNQFEDAEFKKQIPEIFKKSEELIQS